MVVLVMIDGARPDALDARRCPHITALRERGSSTTQAQSVLPSITLPCHMSIFHSVPPGRHGITANQYLPMARPLPGLIETLHACGLRSACIYSWEPLRDVGRPEVLNYAYYRKPLNEAVYEQSITDEAVHVISERSFDFVFVYFGSIDGAGHLHGWMSPPYLEQLSLVDAAIGQLVEALPFDATIIVHSDHGGHERTHGTALPEDMTIPWVAAGPTIRRDHVITSPVSLLDTAPTIARVLGVASPPAWEGRVLQEILV